MAKEKAPKKKTMKFPAGERPKQLSSYAKVTKSAARAGLGLSGPETPRVIPAGEAARRANVIRDADKRIKNTSVAGSKTSTSYSPRGMGAKEAGEMYVRSYNKQSKYLTAKEKAKPKRGPKAGTSTVSKVVKRAKTVAREARDIKTAVGSAAQALRKSPQEGMPVKKTIKNIGTQVKETARAAATGKKGTTAYKVKPDPYSKAARKAAGGKGFVFYDVTKPKKR